MPIAFTAEERTVLTGQLLESTRRFVKEQSARKVTIKQLTDSVGISKGAFYLFYPSKEHLFYALLRQMHTELYGPAMELLEQPKGTPAQQLTCAIPSEERRAQQEQEYAVFRRFLAQNKAADISEEQAINALRSLILTVPMRKKLGKDYPQILLWMAQGICAQIFG